MKIVKPASASSSPNLGTRKTRNQRYRQPKHSAKKLGAAQPELNLRHGRLVRTNANPQPRHTPPVYKQPRGKASKSSKPASATHGCWRGNELNESNGLKPIAFCLQWLPLHFSPGLSSDVLRCLVSWDILSRIHLIVSCLALLQSTTHYHLSHIRMMC